MDLASESKVLDEISRHPEHFIQPSPEIQSQLKTAMKVHFDHAVQLEKESGLSFGPLSELYIDGFDAEQIWEELKLRSDPFLEHAEGMYQQLSSLPKDKLQLFPDEQRWPQKSKVCNLDLFISRIVLSDEARKVLTPSTSVVPASWILECAASVALTSLTREMLACFYFSTQSAGAATTQLSDNKGERNADERSASGFGGFGGQLKSVRRTGAQQGREESGNERDIGDGTAADGDSSDSSDDDSAPIGPSPNPKSTAVCQPSARDEEGETTGKAKRSDKEQEQDKMTAFLDEMDAFAEQEERKEYGLGDADTSLERPDKRKGTTDAQWGDDDDEDEDWQSALFAGASASEVQEAKKLTHDDVFGKTKKETDTASLEARNKRGNANSNNTNDSEIDSDNHDDDDSGEATAAAMLFSRRAANHGDGPVEGSNDLDIQQLAPHSDSEGDDESLLSVFQKHQQRLKRQIASLEEEAIAAKAWSLIGEAKGNDRFVERPACRVSCLESSQVSAAFRSSS